MSAVPQAVEKPDLSHFLNPDDWDLSRFPVERIKRPPENDHIYGRFALANEDDASLYLSICNDGIHEPLVLSRDGYLLSGNRRHAAARLAGIAHVPVRIMDIDYSSLNQSERLDILRRFNQQRDKTPEERIREQLVSINPADAYARLRNRRAKAYWRDLQGTEPNIELGTSVGRSAITTMQFLAAAQAAIESEREFWPVTVRRVHYLLLNNPPLRHDRKPGSVYVNNAASYKALTNLLLRARLARLIPMHAIEDATRPTLLGGGFASVEQFIAQELQNLFAGYWRNLQQGQRNHVEIVLEKNALRRVIEQVAREYGIPVTTIRGYSSLSPRDAINSRFRRSGRARLVLLMMTDFDPDGDEIASSFARSMRDDFGIKEPVLRAIKVALTAEDVAAHDFPSDMDAKRSSVNYQKFVERHGTTKAVELDAAPVEFLQRKLREAIEAAIDIDAFNAQVELEQQDAAHLEAYRATIMQTVAGIKIPDAEGSES